MTTTRFNNKRFGQLLRACTAGRQHTFVVFTLVVMLVILADDVINFVRFSGDFSQAFDHSIANSMFCVVCAAMIFYNVFCRPLLFRQSGSCFLAFPASNLERYLALMAIHFVGFGLMLIVSMFGAELLWQAAMLLLAPENYQGLLTPELATTLLKNGGITLLFTLVAPLEFIGVKENRSLKALLLRFLVVVMFLMSLIVLLFRVLHQLGLSAHTSAFLIVLITVLLLLSLQPRAYRAFCRYEAEL